MAAVSLYVNSINRSSLEQVMLLSPTCGLCSEKGDAGDGAALTM